MDFENDVVLKPLEEGSFLVVGVVRNCGKFLRQDVEKIHLSLQKANNVKWLLVESDSEDNTLGELSFIKSSVAGFDFISLGKLRDKFTARTERISYCRNIYLEEIKNKYISLGVDFVVVADFDGINDRISSEAIESCWVKKNWDVCTANQCAPYYDVWALRHALWAPNDCLANYDFLNRYTRNKYANKEAAIYSRMIQIPVHGDWIEVESAFGGLAIYKSKLFLEAKYSGIGEEGVSICEHVPFNLALNKKGYRIFINPELVNTGYTEHTRKMRFAGKMKRCFFIWLSLVLQPVEWVKRPFFIVKNTKNQSTKNL